MHNRTKNARLHKEKERGDVERRGMGRKKREGEEKRKKEGNEKIERKEKEKEKRGRNGGWEKKRGGQNGEEQKMGWGEGDVCTDTGARKRQKLHHKATCPRYLQSQM